MKHTHLSKFILSKLVLSILICITANSINAFAETRKFNLIAKEVDGTKHWFLKGHTKKTDSLTLTVNQGDTVKIHAISATGATNNVHGFAIDQFKVSAVVDGKGKDIEFVANQAGTYPIYCQLHPKHVGGQLVVK